MTNILMAIAAFVLLTHGFIFFGAILLAGAIIEWGVKMGIKKGRREMMVGKVK